MMYIMEKRPQNDKIQSQSHACYARHDTEKISRADGHQATYSVRNLHRLGQAHSSRGIRQDLRRAGLPARRSYGVCQRHRMTG